MANDIYSLAQAYQDNGPGYGEGLQMPRQALPDRMTEMAQMLEKPAESTYQPQLQEALGRRQANEEAFNQMIKAAMTRKEESGPSKAEMYFRLAAAFGSPTQGGTFIESLGNAGKSAGDMLQAQREAQAAERDKLLNLGIQGQKMAMDSNRKEVSSLRQLAGEEMRDKRASSSAEAAEKRAMALKQYEALLQSGKPQSEAGKYAADQGFKPGTPEFAKAAEGYFKSKMDNGDFFKQAQLMIAQGNQNIAQMGLQLRQQQFQAGQQEKSKLTPVEVKMKLDAENELGSLKDLYTDLKEAMDLNSNSYAKSLPDTIKYTALSKSGSTDPKVINTARLENLLGEQVLTKLSALKGAASDNDMKVMQSLTGNKANTPEERRAIIERATKIAVDAYKLKKKQYADIAEGRMRIPQQSLPDTLE